MAVHIPLTTDSGLLFATLRSIDISVPGRTEGRTTHHTETWTICRLLSTLANTGYLSYPMSLMHRDKPDFFLAQAHRSIGIEVTEAITQQYAAFCALQEREFPGVWIEPAHFRWDAPERSTEEMREILRQGRLSSDGWAGDSPEREWALFILSAVDNKLKKLAQPDFAKFDENWLAIYDNLPLPFIGLADAVGLLRPALADRWARNPAFHALFIEHGPVIVRITASDSTHVVLNDLWS